MIIYFETDKEGYLNGWSSSRSNEREIELEVEEDHEVLRNSRIFKYVDGELIKDEERQQQLIGQYEKELNKQTETDKIAMALMDLAEILLNGGDE